MRVVPPRASTKPWQDLPGNERLDENKMPTAHTAEMHGPEFPVIGTAQQLSGALQRRRQDRRIYPHPRLSPATLTVPSGKPYRRHCPNKKGPAGPLQGYKRDRVPATLSCSAGSGLRLGMGRKQQTQYRRQPIAFTGPAGSPGTWRPARRASACYHPACRTHQVGAAPASARNSRCRENQATTMCATKPSTRSGQIPRSV